MTKLGFWISQGESQEGLVLCCDLKCPFWFWLTLDFPFTDVLWSAPCQSWSLAGSVAGLAASVGALFVHILGLLLIFKPLRSIGENVAGLVQHPHWSRLSEMISRLPHHFRLCQSDLADFAPMTRKRCFLMFDLLREPKPLPCFKVEYGSWFDVGCGELDDIALESTRFTNEQRLLLSRVDLLPVIERRKSQQEGVTSGDTVFVKRLAGRVLPTLVSAYREQCFLPEKNLRAKGILTWVVSDDGSMDRARFLENFEGLRLLGFPFGHLLPEEVHVAARAVGNVVSPIQAALAIHSSMGLPGVEMLIAEVRRRLYCQIPLRHTTRVDFGGLRHLAVVGFDRLTFLKTDQSTALVFLDNRVSPISVRFSLEQPVEVALGQTVPGTKVTCRRGQIRHCDDCLQLFIALRPIRIRVIGLETTTLDLSPMSCLADYENLFKAVSIDQPGSTGSPLWMFGQETLQALGTLAPGLGSDVRLLFGTDVRIWTYREKVAFQQVIDEVFPFGIGNIARVFSQNCQLDVATFPEASATYRVDLDPVALEVPPLGAVFADPLTPLAEIGTLLSLKHFAGRASVRVVVNGTIPSHDISVAFAKKVGELRAKIYALPGGAMTLSSVVDGLQALLVAHGHPSSTVSQKVDILLGKVDVTRCKQILESKHPWTGLKTAGKEFDIVLIPPESRGSRATGSEDKVFNDDPWAAYKAKPVPATRAKKPVKPQKSGLAKVDVTYFHAAQKPLPSIDLNQLLQGHPGLLVCQVELIQPHLPSLCTSLCVGPAAVLLVGVELSELPPDLKCASLVVPGWVGAQAAALQCVLLQVGDEPVEFWSAGALTIPAESNSCQVVQFHVYKDECSRWSELVEGSFEVFLKKIGFACPMGITQTWAFGFFTRGKKASPEEAAYHHGFLKLEEKAVSPHS